MDVIILIAGLAITAGALCLMYLMCQKIVKSELEKALPNQLQIVREKLDGDLKIMLSMKKDGETKIESVDTD